MTNEETDDLRAWIEGLKHSANRPGSVRPKGWMYQGVAPYDVKIYIQDLEDTVAFLKSVIDRAYHYATPSDLGGQVDKICEILREADPDEV